MNLLRIKKELNRDSLKSIFNEFSGWYFGNDFTKILKQERHRSDRTGSPISYIIINISGKSNDTKRILDGDYHKFLRELVVLISKNVRESDIKHFIVPATIGILLIDTAIHDAKALIDRISKKLYDHFESLNKENYMNIIQSISISTYPLSQMSEWNLIEAKPVVIKKLKFVKEKENSKLMLREKSDFYFHWNIQPLANGTIGFTMPILWDIINENQIHLISQFLKRLIDIVGSLIGIILSLPLMILVSILIKMTSKGPIFFKQTRLGYLGTPFTFFKFRTMKNNCDDQIHKQYVKKLIEAKNDEINLGTVENPQYKLTKDPRVTSIGLFLRKLSIDELPQLFNVLKGEMSLVGPRPPISYEIEEYQNWHYRRILEVKPGITGLWQVSGRNKTTFDEMVRLDIHYAENWSLWLDIKILFKTIKVLFYFNGY